MSYTKNLKQAKAIAAFWKNLGFQEVEEIPAAVNHINFSYTQVTDEELGWMTEKIKSIEMLDLKDTAISIEGIRHLTKMEHIGELRLKECTAIDDDCLPLIDSIKGLHFLQLNATGISHHGLAHLYSLSTLKQLLLSLDEEEPEVLESLRKLQTALPSCLIVLNGKDFAA